MVQNLANIGITNQYGSQFVNGLFNNFDEELNKISETNDKIFYILDFLTSNYFKKLNQQIKYEFIIKLVDNLDNQDNLDNPLLEMIFEEITLMNDNIIFFYFFNLFFHYNNNLDNKIVLILI